MFCSQAREGLFVEEASLNPLSPLVSMERKGIIIKAYFDNNGP